MMYPAREVLIVVMQMREVLSEVRGVYTPLRGVCITYWFTHIINSVHHVIYKFVPLPSDHD